MPRLWCSNLRPQQYQWISCLVVLCVLACHERQPSNVTPAQPPIRLTKKQRVDYRQAFAAPRGSQLDPIRQDRNSVVQETTPRHDVVLFADLQSPFFERQKAHLQQLIALPPGTFDFYFYDWATPYHRTGHQLAMHVHQHNHPLKALLDVSTKGTAIREPRSATSKPLPPSIDHASNAEIRSRHQHLGIALKIPSEVVWILDGQIIDGTRPESVRRIDNTLRRMRQGHGETPAGPMARTAPSIDALRKRLADRFLDYQYGVWLSADLGPPAPDQLVRYAHPTGTDGTQIPVRNSIIVLGVPDDASTLRAVAQAEKLGSEVDAEVTWLKVAQYSDTDARRRVSLAYTSEQDEAYAYQIAQHFDIRRVPAFILDGIPTSTNASMSAIRAIWARRADAQSIDDRISTDVPRSAPALHPMGTGPDLTVFADTAIQSHRILLQRLISPAQRGEWTIHMHHLPGASNTSRTRAQRLHELASVSTARDYWAELLDPRTPSTPATNHARTSLARDIAWARRTLPQSSNSRDSSVLVHLLMHRKWVTIGLSAPEQALREYKDAILPDSAD